MDKDDKRYQIYCSLNNENIIECIDENGRKIDTTLEIIDKDNLILIYSPDENLFKYSIEIKTNTLYRIICNGEIFSEFTWGNERYTRWDTRHYVNRLTCLFSKNINLIRINKDLLVGFNTTLNYDLLGKEINIINEWKTISNFNIYDMYTIVYDLDIPLDKISPPLLLGKEIQSFTQKLIESSIFLNTLKGNRYINSFIDILTKAIINKKYPYIILAYIAFRENVLREIILNRKSCIEYREENSHVIISNKCTDKLRLFIIGSNGFLYTVLDKNKDYKISRELIGLIEKIISWRLS